MNKKEINRWQLIRNNCKYCHEKHNHGTWCSKLDKKCSFSNCNIKDTPPMVSNGNKIEKKNMHTLKGDNDKIDLLTSQQTKALKLRNKGLSFAFIGEKMNISKTRAWILVSKATIKLGVNEAKKRGVNDKLGKITTRRARGITIKTHEKSLHNDSISINAKINFKEAEGEVKHLKYVDYKFIKSEETIIKIFPKKVVIQFRKDIRTQTIQECYDKATKRIENFLNTLSIKGVELKKEKEVEQLSRHYAIIGTGIARKYIREGKKLFIYDKYDGKERVRIDYSEKKKGGLPHFELTHPLKSKKDGDATDNFFNSIINNPHYLPHETKAIVDSILSVQNAYAHQIKTHLKVENRQLMVQDKTLEVHSETLKTLKKIQKKIK